MATKRGDIQNLVNKTMENRDISSNTPKVTLPEGGKRKYPPKQQVQIRFDPGDYEALQDIAHRRGTKAAALIREAVKEIIRKEG